MKILVILLLTVALVSAQKAYPPGLNVMMKDIIIDKVREIVIPDLVKEFGTVKPADIGVKHSLYEAKLYDMEGDADPVSQDNIQVVTKHDDNSMYAAVKNIHVHFHCRAYGRALFIHAHGDAKIKVGITEFSFKVQPKLKADGDLNELDYHVEDVKIDLRPDDIEIEHLSIGILPNWLLKPLFNAVIHSCVAAFDMFEDLIDKIIVLGLNHFRERIPDSEEIPGSPFSVSLSFPDVPQLYDDRIELPFDGTIYVTQEGYHPQKDPAPPMPSYNKDNPNNVQVFLNQHMLKASFDAARRSEYRIKINSDTLKPLNLTDDLMKVEYFSMLFPELLWKYDKDTPIVVLLGVDKKLNSEIDFAVDKVHGEFSPYIEVHAGNDLALALSIRTILDATIKFKTEGKATHMSGSLDNIDLKDYTVTKGTIDDSGLGEIIKGFTEFVTSTIKKAANKALTPGFTIPVVPLIKTMFEIDIDDIEIVLKDKYMEASLTVDIHQKMRMIQELLKLQVA